MQVLTPDQPSRDEMEKIDAFLAELNQPKNQPSLITPIISAPKQNQPGFRSFFAKVILIVILILAFISRYHFSKDIGNFSFGDGGRDVLVAKHISDGSASPFISPNSSFHIIPNTPVYFWVLAVGYKLYGLQGIVAMHIAASMIVVYLSYKISLLLWKNEFSALATTFFAAISILLIQMSGLWQTYIQLAFMVYGIYLMLKIFQFHKEIDYWLALIPLWFILCMHNNGIILSLLMSLGLIWDYTERNEIKLTSAKNWFFLAAITSVWVSFLVLGYGILTNFNPWYLLRTEIVQNTTKVTLAEKTLSLIQNFYKMSEGNVSFPFWIKLIILPLIIFGLGKNFVSGPLTKKTSGFLGVTILSSFSYFLMPVNTFNDWYFIAQIYLAFLLLINLPELFFKNNLIKKLSQLILWTGLFMMAWPSFRNLFFPSNYWYQESKVLAERILLDSKLNHLKPNDFSIIINNYNSNRSLEDMQHEWGGAGIQFMLETFDPSYQYRLKFANNDVYTQNFEEPQDTKIHYVFCRNYPDNAPDLCGESFYSKNNLDFTKNYLGKINYHGNRPIYIFKLTEI